MGAREKIMKKNIKYLFYSASGLVVLVLLTFIYKKYFSSNLRIRELPVLHINLDKEPEHRWDDVIAHMDIALISQFDHVAGTFLEPLNNIQPYIARLAKSPLIPDEYQRELHGIIQALDKRSDVQTKNITYENLVLLSLAYDMAVHCLAGIIVGTSNEPYLFRNFDWHMPSLHKALVYVQWHKQGKLLFTSIGAPFILSIFTGQRHGAFALALNARYSDKRTIQERVETYLKTPVNIWSSGILARYALEYMSDYHHAYTLCKSAQLITPVYFALAGTQSDEGVIIARDCADIAFKDKITQWQQYYSATGKPVNPYNSRSPIIIDPQHAQNRYIIRANGDSTEIMQPQDLKQSAPNRCAALYTSAYRRNSALNSCCTLKSDFSHEDLLYHVLAQPPVRNKCTLYAAVMSPARAICNGYGIW